MSRYTEGLMRQGAQLAKLAQRAGLYRLDGKRRVHPFGGWYQTVLIGEVKYVVGVEPGPRVRIAFKPRGTYGRRWHGSVRLAASGRAAWSGEVDKSTGVFALLRYADLVPSTRIGEAIVAWGAAIRDRFLAPPSAHEDASVANGPGASRQSPVDAPGSGQPAGQ